MTFVDHAIEGALFFSIPAVFARVRVSTLTLIMAIGFLWGMTPDFAGWVVALAYPDDPRVAHWDIVVAEAPVRWDVYHAFHQGPVLKWVFFLHTIDDIPFHTPDSNWWPREWKRASVHWLAELIGIAGIGIYIKQKKRGKL